jgi:hypothetical protein
MGYEKLNSRRFAAGRNRTEWHGNANSKAAAVPSDTGTSVAAKQALPSETAKTDGVIVVAEEQE